MSNIGLRLASLVEKRRKEYYVWLVIYDLACTTSRLTPGIDLVGTFPCTKKGPSLLLLALIGLLIGLFSLHYQI